MSLNNRARALARTAGLSYQQALNALRTLGKKPADVAKDFHWPLQRADAYSLDPKLDDEFAEVSSRGSARYVEVNHCDECNAAYFQGFDKKRMLVSGSDNLCPGCIDEYGSWECPRCGAEVAGSGDEGVCSACWSNVMAD